MRTFIFLFIVQCIFVQAAMACTCVGNNFCENIDLHFSDINELIFQGTFIQSNEPIGPFVPKQYKVEEIYFGEIVTPSSPLFINDGFINTDSTVWILTGNSAFCMPDMVHQSAVIAVGYNQEGGGLSLPDFGYSAFACLISYLPVSEDGYVSGWINQEFVEDTMSLEEFPKLFDGRCSGVNATTEAYDLSAFTVQPQPTTGYVNITMPEPMTDWNITLYDIDGRSLQSITESSIDLSALNAGVYFMAFERDRHRYTKRIVKI